MRRGGFCCVFAEPNDCPAAPSPTGEGLPFLPLGWGGEAAGSMLGGGADPAMGGERERGAHTTGVSSKLTGVSSEFAGVSDKLTGVNSELAGVSNERAGVSSELRKVSTELTGVSSELRKVSSELTGVSSELAGLAANCQGLSAN
jgi:hypothetical protein